MPRFGPAAALAATILCTGMTQSVAQTADDMSALRQHALELVNADRAEAGLPALETTEALTEAAQTHADAMVEGDFYAHVAPDGETPRDRFMAAGGDRWAVSGENIAMCSGCTPPADTGRLDAFQSGWMQSPDHREAILSPGYDRFGFGVAGGGDTIYAVQTFAGPGADSDGPGLSTGDARRAALEAINARRDDQGAAAVQADGALDTMADRLLAMRLEGRDLPQDIFGLLPDGATGWTSIAIRTASRGGAGTEVTAGVVEGFVDDWAEAGQPPLGGSDAGFLGFAASADGSGRAAAVAVFGGRD